ncbi:MAG: DUF433 domain-containing protein [Chloroflexia bacterium]
MTLSLTTDILPLVTDEQGSIRVKDSRVTLDLLVTAFESGAGPEEIARRLPNLNLADLHLILGWYMHHKADVDVYIAERRQAAAALRAEIEARWPPQEFQRRLDALRSEQEA